jgi:hypothetical protein
LGRIKLEPFEVLNLILTHRPHLSVFPCSIPVASPTTASAMRRWCRSPGPPSTACQTVSQAPRAAPPPLLLFLGAPSQPPPSSPFSPLLQRAESPHAPAFEFFYDSPHFAPTCQGVAASCPSTFCPSRWQPESFPPPEIEPECCRLPLLGETPPWVFLLKLKGHSSSTGDHYRVLADDESHWAALSPPPRWCRHASVSPRLPFHARRVAHFVVMLTSSTTSSKSHRQACPGRATVVAARVSHYRPMGYSGAHCCVVV